MDTRVSNRLKALLLTLTLLNWPGAAGRSGAGFESRQGKSVFKQRISGVQIPRTNLLDALVRIGQASNMRIGVVLSQRSIATAEVTSWTAENITLGDTLEKLLQETRIFTLHEEERCAVLEPTSGGLGYLRTRIPSFKVERVSIDIASYDLSQALLATEPQPLHKGPWGTATTILSSSDASQVGPLEVKGFPVGAILSKLATQAGPAMWIAIPRRRQEDWRGYSVPWRFLPYSPRPSETQLRLIVDDIPE